MSKKKPPAIAYVLAPGQTLRDYKALERKWYAKLKAKEFKDIEYLGLRGYPSPYSRDYSLSRIRQEYNPAAEAHFRHASIFLHEFSFSPAAICGLSRPLARYIWAHYAAGHTLRHTVKALNGAAPTLIRGPLPRKRYAKGKPEPVPSVYWVYCKLYNVLMPAFKAWVKENPEAIKVDWVLD